jgi:KaiC/GvpD/RAD55 family RecA-like ATPase/5S rRNA maturation endonuclease (ribonuclease M5)
MKGWPYQLTSNGEQMLMDCPICGKEKHFYLSVEKGLWDCKVCGRTGNLYALKKEMGEPIPGVQSMQESIPHALKPLPDIEKCHAALLADYDTLKWLTDERQFSIEVIESMRLGLWEEFGKKYVTYPYINGGKYQFLKGRTVPPQPKDFLHAEFLTGRQNPLYHADAIHPNNNELILVEGEPDTLTMLTWGYNNTIGVPGANMKKAVWIDRLDVWWSGPVIQQGEIDSPVTVRKIYLLYDSDHAGQEAAEEIAKRIGLDRIWLIKLPPFKKKDGSEGKDITEWKTAGHTKEEFEALKAAARQYDVKGITSMESALDEIEADIEARGTADPPLKSPWKPLNKAFGGAEFGDVIGIVAEAKIGKTTLGMNWLDYFVDKMNLNCMLLCFEMPPKRIARKWACSVTDTDDTPGKSQFTKETVIRARQIIAERPADFLLGYTSAQDPKKVIDLIRQTIRRYGVKVVMIDYLQQMCHSLQHQAQEISNLSKAIKDLAMELGVLILLIIQPKRVGENEIVAARHVLGSSGPEKDVDVMICLHRNRQGVMKADEFIGYTTVEENFSPFMLVRADLSRFAPGGAITLYMEGGKSLVREMTTEDEQQSRTDQVSIIGPDIPVEGQSKAI